MSVSSSPNGLTAILPNVSQAKKMKNYRQEMAFQSFEFNLKTKQKRTKRFTPHLHKWHNGKIQNDSFDDFVVIGTSIIHVFRS
jgi:hypothetical protein